MTITFNLVQDDNLKYVIKVEAITKDGYFHVCNIPNASPDNLRYAAECCVKMVGAVVREGKGI